MRNIDYEYVYKQQAKNDETWQKREKNLYYSVKNKDYIIPSLLGCVFFGILDGGLAGVILILAFDWWLCDFNNKELDKWKTVLEEREKVREFRREYLGEDV